MGDLTTPSSVQKLQTALHAKAKAEPDFRFYLLYDKVYRADILAHAYACCKLNKGAAGVDGQCFADIEAYGVERWLGELAQAIKEGNYRPEPVRRVLIPNTTRNKDEKRGTPQGSPLSPLLANVYMRQFILGWKRCGLEVRYGARIVNYADDMVICCKHSADKALVAMRRLMERLKLTVNEEKTRLCRVPEEQFHFLGYTFGPVSYTHLTLPTTPYV